MDEAIDKTKGNATLDINDKDIRLELAKYLEKQGWNVILVADHGIRGVDPTIFRYEYFIQFMGGKKKPKEEEVKPDYEGFVKEFDERMEKGLPIDRTTMEEMAERYHTPVPCDEDCQAFRCNCCETKSRDGLCDKGGRKTIY